MTLEGLLAFVGIVLAALAIARPVQRRSLTVFFPAWLLPTSILVSFVFIVCRDAPFGARPPFGLPLSQTLYALTVASFIIPVITVLSMWLSWHQARITKRNGRGVEDIFRAALREQEFDEVDRILGKNRYTLDQLPTGAVSVLFASPMVTALLDAHSLIHLELLSNLPFLRSLDDRFSAVDVVVRELLKSDLTPIRPAVVSQYGGLEHLKYTDADRELMERTFLKPEWYLQAAAHYPLIMAALESMRNGKLDVEYNGPSVDYEANQGISARSHCPIYLAVKTEVLAVTSAIEKRVVDDYYISDLWQIFQAILEHSKYDPDVWENNGETPTPYAYLLREVMSDLESLSSKTVQVAVPQTDPSHTASPNRIATDLARFWSACTCTVAESQDQVSDEFRRQMIEQYLVFILKLGWEPGEILNRFHDKVELSKWRDLFLKELKTRMRTSRQRTVIEDAFDSLDTGKVFVNNGSPWLGSQLFGRPLEEEEE